MKRQRVKFPWDLYWENKTYKLIKKRFIGTCRKVPLVSIRHYYICIYNVCCPAHTIYFIPHKYLWESQVEIRRSNENSADHKHPLTHIPKREIMISWLHSCRNGIKLIKSVGFRKINSCIIIVVKPNGSITSFVHDHNCHGPRTDRKIFNFQIWNEDA